MYRLHQDRRVALDCVFDGCSVLLLKDADVARVAQLLTTERRFAVKPSLLLIPMILATSAAIGDARADAHAQAAAPRACCWRWSMSRALRPSWAASIGPWRS